MLIYVIGENGYYGGSYEVSEDTQGIPLGTTRTEVPSIPEGSYARWNGSGWDLTDIPPSAPVAYSEPIPEPVDPTVELIQKIGIHLNLTDDQLQQLISEVLPTGE